MFQLAGGEDLDFNLVIGSCQVMQQDSDFYSRLSGSLGQATAMHRLKQVKHSWFLDLRWSGLEAGESTVDGRGYSGSGNMLARSSIRLRHKAVRLVAGVAESVYRECGQT